MAWKLKKIGGKWNCVNTETRQSAGPSDSLAMAKEHLRTLNSDSPTAASEPAGSDVVYCGAPVKAKGTSEGVSKSWEARRKNSFPSRELKVGDKIKLYSKQYETHSGDQKVKGVSEHGFKAGESSILHSDVDEGHFAVEKTVEGLKASDPMTPKLTDIVKASDESQISLDDLRQQVRALAAEDSRFVTASGEMALPSGQPYCDNILLKDGAFSAILCCGDSKMWEVGFEVSAGEVTELLDDAKPVKVQRHYVAASEPFKFNGKNVISATGAIVPVEVEEFELVYCKDAGNQLPAEKKWEFGKPVEFMWAPGGKTQITAGCAGRSLRLWVIGDAKGASDVQNSFATAVAASPRRLPYGCIEHQEKERAFEPKQFAWKESPEPGIYCSAIPTKLGESNVNGRMQTSFSPCFRHDARFSTAKCTDCDKGATECECDGTLEFPNGVRGSESNPAHIVGVFEKSVGSLTNWPAFKDILPVTAKEPDTTTRATGTSEGVSKSWETRKKENPNFGLAKGSIFGLSERAYTMSTQAAITNKHEDHIEAGKAHFEMKKAHDAEALEKRKAGNESAAKEHDRIAHAHNTELDRHIKLAKKSPDAPDWAKATDAVLIQGMTSEPVKPTLETIYAKHAGEVVTAGAPAGNKNAAGAHEMSRMADISSARANESGSFSDHVEATVAHHDAFQAHMNAAEKDTGGGATHYKKAGIHAAKSDFHAGKAEEVRKFGRKLTPDQAAALKEHSKASEPTAGTATGKKPTLETIFAKRPKLTLETIYARGVNGQPAGRN
jgi:hypothetical protein